MQQKSSYEVLLQQIKELVKAALAQELTEEELTKFKFIVDGSNEECYLFESDGRLKFANQAAANNLGYTIPEMMELGISDLDPLCGHNFQDHLGALRKGPAPETTESVYIAKDGRRVPKKIKSAYLKINDKEYLCRWGHDITDHKQGEKNQEKHLAPLEKLTEERTIARKKINNQTQFDTIEGKETEKDQLNEES